MLKSNKTKNNKIIDINTLTIKLTIKKYKRPFFFSKMLILPLFCCSFFGVKTPFFAVFFGGEMPHMKISAHFYTLLYTHGNHFGHF